MTRGSRVCRMLPMVRRSFTPSQANRTLPLVKRIVAEILEKGRELTALGVRRREESDDDGSLQLRMDTIEMEMRDLLAELERIGCSYKDWGFEKGLVDFPGEIEGRQVLLCWRSDEESVSWYHTPEEGYSGRTPIPEQLLADDAG